MPRIPLNLFGASFGISGLAGAWTTAAGQEHVPAWIGEALFAVAAVIWLLTIIGYAGWAVRHRPGVRADLTDPVAAPFAALAVITPVLLAAGGIAPHAPVAGAVVVDVFVALTVVHGSWFVGQLVHGRVGFDQLHPGYFLPTVAGGLIGAQATATVGQHLLGEVLFGYGLISWLVIGAMIMARLFFRPALPGPLTPTIAIQVAPAAVASLAHFALDGPAVDLVAAALAGYGVLMVGAQLPLLATFRRLPFGTGHWAFTVSWAAVVSATLHWTSALAAPAQVALTYVLLTAVTLLVGGIGMRTIFALGRGGLLPAAPSASSPAAQPLAPVGSVGHR